MASGRDSSGVAGVAERGRAVTDPEIEEVLGSTAQMQRVLGDIWRVAPTDFTVLITGETGTGKEVVARSIHRESSRSQGPFIAVDCGAIAQSLVESELFGHEKGAFSGAEETRRGRFEIASGGTLFLDEISNLPMQLQPQLLRVLQEKQIWRVGGNRTIDLDIRVIAACDQAPGLLVQKKLLRRDLYYRLNEFRIAIPPLRDRLDDVGLLANYFLDQANRDLGKRITGFSERVAGLLGDYSWPGNVRELRNVVRRAALVAEGRIEVDHLAISETSLNALPFWPEPEPALDGSVTFKEMVREVTNRAEQHILARALEQTDGNKAAAARLLHVDYKTIHNKVRCYRMLPQA